MDAVLADLGISSDQLDDAGRGFAFSHDGPLDMRMDRSAGGPTAGDLVRDLSQRELERLLRDAEEPFARRIAEAIARRRAEAPMTTTTELAGVIASAVPRTRRPGLHPATLTFQALRMAVNTELAGLDGFVRDAASVLAPGGRLAVIAFHGGEDRIVKNALKDLAGRCTCPAAALTCTCGRVASVRVLTRKPLRPGAREIEANPRSRSARLRCAERIVHRDQDVADARRATRGSGRPEVS